MNNNFYTKIEKKEKVCSVTMSRLCPFFCRKKEEKATRVEVLGSWFFHLQVKNEIREIFLKYHTNV